MLKFILTFLFICFLWPIHAFAQIDVLKDYREQDDQTIEEEVVPERPEPFAQGRDPVDSITGAKYKEYVYKVLKQDPEFDFGYFRMLYSNTTHYAPINDEVKKTILTAAYQMQNLPLSKERTDATEVYTQTVLLHLANIDIVLTAWSLSKEDKRFGNPKLYEWMYRGLLDNIMRTGTGETLIKAFYVITPEEETALLTQLRLKVLDTKTVHEGLIYYNMNRVYDLRKKVEYTVFVDTTKPLEFLAEEAEKSKTNIKLRGVN